MIDLEQLRDCYIPTPSKIVMLVVDGLGGLAHPDTGRSELETAHLPNLDAMARGKRLRFDYPRVARRCSGQRSGPPGPVRV